jgi:hypothetical protein
MNKNALWIGLFVVVVGGAAAYYFYSQKKGAATKAPGSVTKADILAAMPTSDRGQYTGTNTPFDKMTQQELADSYRLVKTAETGTEAEKESMKNDTAFIDRINAITAKYNIFT